MFAVRLAVRQTFRPYVRSSPRSSQFASPGGFWRGSLDMFSKSSVAKPFVFIAFRETYDEQIGEGALQG